MTLAARILALLVSLPAAAAAAAPGCDDARAVDAVRTAAREVSVDTSTLQLVVEGPYSHAKFVRTHPTFRTSAALKRRLARRTLYFVWFHPPFREAGARGDDVWALVDAGHCGVLHLARER